MKNHRIYTLTALVTAAALSLMTTAYAAAGSDTLRVGTKGYIVNFSQYNDTTGQYYGLEIDLAREIAEVLGYRDVEFVRVTPDDCEEMLDAGAIDVLIAAYGWTERRASERDLSASYYQDHAAVMCARSTLYTDITDLLGKRIGVIHGSSAWFQLGTYFAEQGYIPANDSDTIGKNFEIVKVDEIDDLYHMLEIGEVDAVVSDRVILRSYYDEDKYFIFEDDLSDEDYTVATRRGSELTEPVAEAVDKLIADGTVDSLIDKWS